FEPEDVDAVRLEKLAARAAAIAGAQDIEARTHQVVGGAVGRHIEKAHPEVGVRRVAGKMDFRGDRAGHFEVLSERGGIEKERARSAEQGAVIVGARIIAERVAERMGRVRKEAAGGAGLTRRSNTQ